MKLHTGKDIIDLILDDLNPQHVRMTYISDLGEHIQEKIRIIPIRKTNSIHFGIEIPEGYKLMKSENEDRFFITMPDIDTNGYLDLDLEPKESK